MSKNKNDDDMLDQTFPNEQTVSDLFDDDQSVQTMSGLNTGTDPSGLSDEDGSEFNPEKNKNKNVNKKSSKSKTGLIVVIGVVLAAIGVAVVGFVLPMFNKPPAPTPKPLNNVNNNPVAPQQIPAQAEIVPPEPSQDLSQNPSIPNIPETPSVDLAVSVPDVNISTQNNPNIPNIPETPVLDINNNPNNPNIPEINIQTPEITIGVEQSPNQVNISVPTTTPEIPTVSINNEAIIPIPNNVPTSNLSNIEINQPQNGNLSDDMKTYLEGKFSNVESRFNKIDYDMNDLKRRVTILEAGKEIKKNNANNINVSNTNNKSKVKPVVKSSSKKVVRKQNAKVLNKIENKLEERVLFEKEEQLLIVNKKEPLQATKKATPISERYNVHSLYAGRLWIKNPDNTHASYTSGDNLPGGEKILEINMESKSIITSDGTIKVK